MVQTLLENGNGPGFFTSRPTHSFALFWNSYVKERSMANAGAKHGRPSITADSLTTTIPSLKWMVLMTTYSITLSFLRLWISRGSLNEKPSFVIRAAETLPMLADEKVLILPNSEPKGLISSWINDSNISASSSSERTPLWLWPSVGNTLLAINKARIEATNRPMNILLILNLRRNTKKPNVALQRLAHATKKKTPHRAGPLQRFLGGTVIHSSSSPHPSPPSNHTRKHTQSQPQL